MPPPTNVGQSPQLSTTVSGTVVAEPFVLRRTMKEYVLDSAGSVTVKLPDSTRAPASTMALALDPN